MQKVYKYAVPITDFPVIPMPEYSKVLSAQVQYDQVFIWALVDLNLNHKMVERKFMLAGTGHPIFETDLDFIGTVQLADGSLIYHLFEILS